MWVPWRCPMGTFVIVTWTTRLPPHVSRKNARCYDRIYPTILQEDTAPWYCHRPGGAVHANCPYLLIFFTSQWQVLHYGETWIFVSWHVQIWHRGNVSLHSAVSFRVAVYIHGWIAHGHRSYRSVNLCKKLIDDSASSSFNFSVMPVGGDPRQLNTTKTHGEIDKFSETCHWKTKPQDTLTKKSLATHQPGEWWGTSIYWNGHNIANTACIRFKFGTMNNRYMQIQNQWK